MFVENLPGDLVMEVANVELKPGGPNRYDQGSIFGPKPPIRSTLMRTISRFSPG
jgi:hypothetical protein